MSQEFSPYQSPVVQVAQQADIPTAQSDDVLFRKIEKKGMSLLTLIVVPLLVCGFLATTAESTFEVVAAIFLCVIFLFLAIPIQIYMIIKGTRTFTLFHDSIAVERHGGSSELYRLDQVVSIRRWKNNRSSSQKFDAFYFFKLTFESGKSIQFATNETLPFLIDSVSRRIAKRMSNSLSDTGVIKWAPSVKIHQDGVKMPIAGVLTRSRLVTWDEFKAVKFVDHHAHVYLHGKKGVATKIECGHSDFFPCLELVREMVRLNTSAAPSACTFEAVACC